MPAFYFYLFFYTGWSFAFFTFLFVTYWSGVLSAWHPLYMHASDANCCAFYILGNFSKNKSPISFWYTELCHWCTLSYWVCFPRSFPVTCRPPWPSVMSNARSFSFFWIHFFLFLLYIHSRPDESFHCSITVSNFSIIRKEA